MPELVLSTVGSSWASVSNATRCPSSLIDGESGENPPSPAVTGAVCPCLTSRRKTASGVLSDPRKATNEPSALIAGSSAALSTLPFAARLTSTVVWLLRSRRYTSSAAVSSGTPAPNDPRHTNATALPSALIAPWEQSACDGAPFAPVRRLTN